MGWHLTSIAWWGFAGMILALALQPGLGPRAWDAVAIMRWTFLVSAVYAFVASRGRHLSWLLIWYDCHSSVVGRAVTAWKLGSAA